VACLNETFEAAAQDHVFEVMTLHPRALPPCDLTRADAEGAEAAILEHLDLSRVSLILLEYQNIENRERIRELLRAEFNLEYEDRFAWDALLGNELYRRELRGNQYGRMFFARRDGNRLRKITDDLKLLKSAPVADPAALSWRQLVSALPGVTKSALQRKISRLL
jgi:hypothetical protein